VEGSKLKKMLGKLKKEEKMKLKELLYNTHLDNKVMLIFIVADDERVMGVVEIINSRNEEVYDKWDYDIEMTDEIKDKQIYYELKLDNENYSLLGTFFDLRNNRVIVLKPKHLKSIAKDLNLKDVDLNDPLDILEEINLKFSNNPKMIDYINNLEEKAHVIGIDKFKPISLTTLSL